MTVLRSNNVCDAIIDYAVKNNIGHIVLGEPPRDCRTGSVVDSLREYMRDVNFYLE